MTTTHRLSRSVLTSLVVALFVASAVAQEASAPSTSSAPRRSVDSDLPVTRVVLSTAGVGYFEHAGTVDGDVELELRVATDGMDDLLQSLVLQDLDGGSIQPVRYGSRDPLGRTLASYALDLSGDPSLAELLAQARGEALTLRTDVAIAGTLVNVERTTTDSGGQATLLTLSTAEGLRRVDLADVRDLRFEREALRADLDAALAALALHRDGDANVVRLRFDGDGERRVRVGYVREMPVWKPSYRLVLGADGRADLQGWAIFDNPTSLDLVDVEVAFVAGRPISFVSELFEPVYVERRRVGPSVAEGFVPPVDAGAFGLSAERFAAPAPSAPAFADALEAEPALAGAGVNAMAEGVVTGTSFSYVVRDPVSVGRFESAMIPVLVVDVPAAQVSFHDGHGPGGAPLHAVRVVNDSGLHLAAGPVTLFDAGGFAGAALMDDVPPGESRLLSYAIDLGLAVATETSGEPERLTAVALRGGLLETVHLLRLHTTVRVTGADEARFVVIELPQRTGYDVVAPTPAPVATADGLRFGVALVGATAPDGADDAAADDDAADGAAADAAATTAAAGSGVPTHLTCAPADDCRLEVVYERTESRTLALADVAPDRLALFLENPTIDDEDRAVLERVVDLRTRLTGVAADMADLRSRLDAVFRDQERVRQNMAALDRNASLYRRYLADLEAQENEVDAIETGLAARTEDRRQLEATLAELIAGLAEDAVD